MHRNFQEQEANRFKGINEDPGTAEVSRFLPRRIF